MSGPGDERGAGGRDSPGEWRVPGDEEPPQAAEESMAGFRRKQDGIAARFSAAQAGIVRNLVSQVAELVGDQAFGAEDVSTWPGGETPPERPAGRGRHAANQSEPAPFGIDDLAAILGGDGPTEPPADPVLARLFPNAYSDDPEAAGEFRRFTEQGLRAAKIDNARRVLATLPGDGGRVRLSDDDAHAWLRALNDVRLALGVRLGITDDYEELAGQIDRDDPRAAYVYVYDWLTFLQDTLVRALW